MTTTPVCPVIPRPRDHPFHGSVDTAAARNTARLNLLYRTPFSRCEWAGLGPVHRKLKKESPRNADPLWSLKRVPALLPR